MQEKIAGHPIPKWEVNDAEIIGGILNNIETKSILAKKIEEIEKARTTRTLAGICNICRVGNCLCNEGQR